MGGREDKRDGGREKKLTTDFLRYTQNRMSEPDLKLMAVTGPQSW